MVDRVSPPVRRFNRDVGINRIFHPRAHPSLRSFHPPIEPQTVNITANWMSEKIIVLRCFLWGYFSTSIK